MEKVFIVLGGNVGNVKATFDIAIKKINEIIGQVIKISSRYETEPWVHKTQDYFLNQIVCVETSLHPQEVLKKVQDIENMLGRKREKNNQFASRTIDIDILFYGGKIINTNNLIIPHPRLHLRNFVLTPLMEIAPGLMHPSLNKKIKDLFKVNTDTSIVKKI